MSIQKVDFELLKNYLSKFLLGGLTIIFLVLLTQQVISGDLVKRGPKVAAAIEAGDCENGWTFLGGDAGDDANWMPGCGNPDGGENQGSTQGPAQSVQPEPTPEPQVSPSCSDDVYYCDNGRNIHKTGGYFDGTECVYDFQDAGSCGDEPQPTPEPERPQTGGITQTVDNSSSSDSNSESRSQSRAQASIRNRITINNNNQQSQSQTVYVTFPKQPKAQVITNKIIKETVKEGSNVRYVVSHDNNCPQGATLIDGRCVVPAPQPQVITAQVVQPQIITVAGGEVKELPKTGAPLALLALGGLTPLGLRLRKFGSKKDTPSANFIWEERQVNIN